MQQETLDALLQALGSDPAKAAAAYRQIQVRLIRLFRLNHIVDPEALADEALDRLARRIASQDAGDIGSPEAFALGIARHLMQEEARRQIRDNQAAANWTSLLVPADAQHEILLEAIEHCLGRMSKNQQELLRSYYQWTGRKKIEHHRQLAESLGLSLNALRNRMMRVRNELDKCVRLSCSDVFENRRTKK